MDGISTPGPHVSGIVSVIVPERVRPASVPLNVRPAVHTTPAMPLTVIKSVSASMTLSPSTAPLMSPDSETMTPLPASKVIGAGLPVTEVPFCVTVMKRRSPTYQLPVRVCDTGAGNGAVTVPTGSVGPVELGAVGDPPHPAANAHAQAAEASRVNNRMPC
jgi:hypothetical protein